MSEVTDEAVQDAVQQQVSVPKQKKAKVSSDNLIQDVAIEIENLTKPKALSMADTLVEDIDTNFFKLGGVLDVIRRNSWYDGVDQHGNPFENFAGYVREHFGFKERKALYLIDIYNNLVTKSIPWDKVKSVGWTKLKDLSKVLTPENVDEWVEKANALTVAELLALLNGGEGGEEGDEASPEAGETTEQMVAFKVKLHPDQSQTVTQALNKAKGEIPTKYDAVALETICLGYLSGNTGAGGDVDLVSVLGTAGIDAACEAFEKAFPNFELSVGDKVAA